MIQNIQSALMEPIVWPAILFWILVCGRLCWQSLRVRTLEELPPGRTTNLPTLSVVIPASNQATTLRATVVSLLDQDYPELAIIIVNDRSTDGTTRLAEELTAKCKNVHSVHVRALPPGWLGKTHALAKGFALSTSDYVLFTDADVLFAPATLQRVMAHVDAEHLDHFTVMPHVIHRTILQELLTGLLRIGILLGWASATIQEKSGGSYVGIGPFNLVRADALRKTEGLEWLRMEPLDDMGIALLLARPPFRRQFMATRGLVSMSWYDSAKAFFVGVEKNFFSSVGHYRIRRAAAMSLLMVLPTLLFLLAMFDGGLPAVVPILGALSLSGMTVARRLRIPTWIVVAMPIGLPLLAAALVNSSFRFIQRQGIEWRGTHYTADELIAGRRVSK